LKLETIKYDFQSTMNHLNPYSFGQNNICSVRNYLY